jgi:hypothetical protein
MKIRIWYNNGAVQEYDSTSEAEVEIAEIMTKDNYPFALIKDTDGAEYVHTVIVKLEKVTNGRDYRSDYESSSSAESEYQIYQI